MKNSDASVLNNQKTIIGNQKKIISNQDQIFSNQKSIIENQKIIVTNQAGIISNQKHIVDNQVALSVLSQSQAIILNLTKKLAGKKESQKDTDLFIEKLTAKAQRALKAKHLVESKVI